MSAVEIVISVSSAAAGAAVGSLAVYFGTKRQAPSNEGEKRDASQRKVQDSISIPRDQLEKNRRELRTLLLEKELVSAALTRLYEAEIAREITREEREILGGKYKTELKALDERISKIDAFIQIGDLETLRNQLLTLVSQKMEAIEKRIESTRRTAEPLIAEMLKKTETRVSPKMAEEKPKVPNISDLIERPETVSPSLANASDQQPMLSIRNMEPISVVDQRFASKKSGEKVEELQKELLEALDRLEKLDVET